MGQLNNCERVLPARKGPMTALAKGFMEVFLEPEQETGMEGSSPSEEKPVEEKKVVDDKKDTAGYHPFRKVFALVPTNNFSKFRRRCNDEGISLDRALATLVIMYGNGGNLVIPSPQKKTVLRECEYLKDREKERANGK